MRPAVESPLTVLTRRPIVTVLVALLLAGCAHRRPDAVAPAAQAANILDYRVIRTWQFGMEVRLRPEGRDPIRSQDVRALDRRLLEKHQYQDTFSILYRGPTGEVVARYVRERSRGVDRLLWYGP